MFSGCRSLYIAAVVLALHMASLILFDGASAALASNLMQLTAALFALALSIRAARRTASNLLRFWLLSSLSFAVWAIAQLLWIWQENVLGRPMPVLAVPHILFFFAFIPMGIALLDEETERRELDWLVVLDILQIVLAAGITYFYLFHFPSLWPNREAVAKSFANAIHLRNAILVSAFCLRSVVAPPGSARRLYANWTLFLFAYSTANFVGAFAIIWVGVPSGTWADLAWSAPFLFAGLIASKWKDEPRPRELAAKFNWGRLLGMNLLPLTIPLLVVLMASRIAMADLTLAAVAICASVGCYGVRTLLLQLRQQRASERLYLSEERFRRFFSAHPQPMWVFEAKTLNFLEVNEAAVRKYGYSRDEFLAMKVTEIKPAEEIAPMKRLLAEIRRSFRWYTRVTA